MFQETPIYNRLVTEQGDVLALVRAEAQQIQRDLERVMPPGWQPAPAWLDQGGAPGQQGG
ncbi:hypothetical protein [Streptomyces sp. NPDC005969]|uniref:hypothetical protein n=1 Tax=Streptomyces sp. NPDC005969 TaxID=3156722 RepID=UPI0033D480B0